MKRRALKPRSVLTSPADDGRIRPCLLGGLCGLAAANVFLPADSVGSLEGAGLPVVVLTLFLAVAWAGAGLRRSGLSLRFGLVDASVVALLAWHSAAAWFGRQGAPRPALNMLWQWLGLGVGFLLARQLIRTSRECRALIAIMLTLCVIESSYAYWSQVVVTPEARRQFEQDKASGFGVRVPGTDIVMDASYQKQYEDRLNSPEPLGNFALTNSLAGLLSPWLIVGLGVVWTVIRSRPLSWRVLVPMVVGLALLGFCLYLAHSRTAQVAAVAGVLMLCATDGGQRLPRRVGWLAGGLLLMLVGAAAAVLRLDSSLLVDGRRSLVIRLEYWQATWQIIREHFWLGCGAGNFRDQYLLHMLPQASETVADPHNFLLELWATSGAPAIAALLVALGGFFWQVVRPTTPADASNSESGNKEGDDRGGPLAMMVGAAVGLVVAHLVALYFAPLGLVTYRDELIAMGLIAGGIFLWLLWPWVNAGRISASLPAIGVAVLFINLLAAGGISYPGVAGSLWLLMAVGLCLTAPGSAPRVVSRAATWLMLLLAVLIAAACEWTALNPVLRSQMILDEAEDARKKGDLQHCRELLSEAAVADPLAERPRRALAREDWLAWLAAPSREHLAAFESSLRQWLESAPHSAAVAKSVGDWYLVMYRKAPKDAFLNAAVLAYRRSVNLYPTSNVFLAHLAWAESLAGQNELATRDAREALRLDGLVRDPDRKLGAALVRIADPAKSEIRPSDLMQEIVAGRHGAKGR